MAEFFEAVMLVCFGCAWPMSIYKLLKTKISRGKSFSFLIIILIGYVSGLSHALLENHGTGHLSYVTYLYILNTSMVSIDLFFSYRYRNN